MPYKNPADKKAANARYRARHRERINEEQRPYQQAYREKCKEEGKPTGYLPEQHNEYHRAYWQRPENKLKQSARARVNRRVSKNVWPRAAFFKCTDCNVSAAHYHHEDYSQWWNVEPLCTSCHGLRHHKKKEGPKTLLNMRLYQATV